MSKKETSTKVIVAEKSDALAQFGQELTDIAITDDSESWGVEKDLVGNEEIFFNAGRLDRSIALKTTDYIRLADPRKENIAMYP